MSESFKKSTVSEIRERFDREVERFSNLETGQVATMDAALVLELLCEVVVRTNAGARGLLDIGCGAGNATLTVLRALPNLDCTLVDLSAPMLERARERVARATSGTVMTLQGDIRDLALPENSYDVCAANAVLHHLRDDAEWRSVFAKIARSLRPYGTLWVSDLVTHESPEIQAVLWEHYRRYLVDLGGDAYQTRVFDYVEREDTPRSLGFQLACLEAAGFLRAEVIHKNAVFATYVAVRP